MRARAESILTALGYGTYGRYEIEQRVGGNASGNDQADYSARVSEEERSLIETVSAGATRQAARRARRGRAGHRRRGGARRVRRAGQPDRQAPGPDDHAAHRRPTRWCSCRTSRCSGDRVDAAKGADRRPRPALHVAAGDLLGRHRRAVRRRALQLHHRAAGRRRQPARRLGARGHGARGRRPSPTYFPGDESVVSHYTPAAWPAVGPDFVTDPQSSRHAHPAIRRLGCARDTPAAARDPRAARPDRHRDRPGRCLSLRLGCVSAERGLCPIGVRPGSR